MPYREKDTFADWVITDDCIQSPSGVTWTPEQLEAWHFEKQLLAELKLQLRTPQQLSF